MVGEGRRGREWKQFDEANTRKKKKNSEGRYVKA